MPVQRFRSPNQAAATLWHDPGDPALVSEIARVWRLGHWLAPWSLPPGIHRFRSVEAMSRQRDEWERTLVRPRFQTDLPPTLPADPDDRRP